MPKREKSLETYRFQVCNSLTRFLPGLRAQQTFLFEDKAASNEDTADYGEDDANDLGGGDNRVVNDARLTKKGRLETLRLPETCKDDFAEEEAEGVDEDMMVRNQACALEDYLIEGAGLGTGSGVGWYNHPTQFSAITVSLTQPAPLLPYIVIFRSVTMAVRQGRSRLARQCLI